MIAWVLKNKVPANPPGVSYDYLNFGYLVLGRVIEEVTGRHMNRTSRKYEKIDGSHILFVTVAKKRLLPFTFYLRMSSN